MLWNCVGRWQDVVRDCNTVLGLPSQSKNIKALFRRSLARRELGDEEQDGAVQGQCSSTLAKGGRDRQLMEISFLLWLDLGKIDLEMILKLEPSNSAAKEELASLRKVGLPFFSRS
jgi:hypothetical protein